jgi:hypothetical protein
MGKDKTVGQHRRHLPHEPDNKRLRQPATVDDAHMARFSRAQGFGTKRDAAEAKASDTDDQR